MTTQAWKRSCSIADLRAAVTTAFAVKLDGDILAIHNPIPPRTAIAFYYCSRCNARFSDWESAKHHIK